MTGKLITSNYFFIQRPCNLFLRGVANKRRVQRLTLVCLPLVSALFIRGLGPPPNIIKRNTNTPHHHPKTWDPTFLLRLKKKKQKDSRHKNDTCCCSKEKPSSNASPAAGSTTHTNGVTSWRFVQLEQTDTERASRVSPSKYSGRTISAAVFPAPSYRGEWPLCAACQLSANGRSLLQVNRLSLATVKKTH